MCCMLALSSYCDVQGIEDWDTVKRKLRLIASKPVLGALRPPRGVRAFRKFDAHESLEQLMLLLKTHSRLPVYRGGSGANY